MSTSDLDINPEAVSVDETADGEVTFQVDEDQINQCSLCGKNFFGPGSKIISEENDPAFELSIICNECSENIQEESELLDSPDVTSDSRDFPSKQFPTCEKCGEEFDDQFAFEEHCDGCSGNNIQDFSHIIHKNFTYDKPFVCTKCGKGFSNRSRLKRHYLGHTGEKPHICNLCDKRFTHKHSYINHLRSHTGEKLWSCKICAKRFTEKKTMIAHQVIHTGEKPFKCQFCNKSFRYKYSLKLHYNSHMEENNYVCNICNRWFRHKKALVNHGYEHTGEMPLCKDCGKTFKSEIRLKNHKCVQEFHSETDKKPHLPHKIMKYSCEVCSKKFYYESTLYVHLQTCRYENFKSYPCEECGKVYVRKNCLEAHYAVHFPDVNYYCEKCKFTFHRKESFISHEKTHKKEYICDICNKKFIVLSSYRNHYVAHSKTVFSCNLCKKKFNSEEDKEMHLRTHSKKLDFVCEICSRVFHQKTKLTKHLQTHENQAEYECFFCSEKFDNDNTLAIHYLSHSTVKKELENDNNPDVGCLSNSECKNSIDNDPEICSLSNSELNEPQNDTDLKLRYISDIEIKEESNDFISL